MNEQRDSVFNIFLWSILTLLVAVPVCTEARIRPYRWNVSYAYKSPDCYEKLVITINGEFPAPTILAQEGDLIHVELTNHLPTENVVIHWHGIRQIGTSWSDGTEAITQCPILPGETFVYKFTLDTPGTYFYHAHYGMQRSAGLYGSIHVAVADGKQEPFFYDGELSVVLNDWWHKSHHEQAQGLSSIPFVWVNEPESLLIEGRGWYNCSLANGGVCNSTNPQCSIPHIIPVKPGKTYRLRITSAASLSSFNFLIEMCVALTIGSNSSTWFNTAVLLTSMINFPQSRGTIVGILKGFVGLSGAIFAQRSIAIFLENPIMVLFLLAVAPTLVSLLSMHFIVPVKPTIGCRDDPEEHEHFLFIIVSCIGLAIYILGFTILDNFVSMRGRFTSKVIAVAMLMFLVVPLLISFRIYVGSLVKWNKWPISTSMEDPENEPLLKAKRPRGDVQNDSTNSLDGMASQSGDREAEESFFAVAYGAVRRLKKGPRRGQDFNLKQTLGHNMTVVEADGQYVEPFMVQDLNIYSGETHSVLITADKDPSRNYWAALNVRGRQPKTPTGRAIFNYVPNPSSMLPPSMLPTGPLWNDTSYTINQAKLYRSRAGYVISPPLQSNRRIVLLNTQNKIDGHIRWAINNISFVPPYTPYLIAVKYNLSRAFDEFQPPENYRPYDIFSPQINQNATYGNPIYTLNFNSIVDVILQNANILKNNTSEIHPWHLHGHGLWVLAYGEGAFDPLKDTSRFNLLNPPMKNTVPVFRFGWTAIRFRADNPGVWQFHCHLEAHLFMGMSVVFAEGVDKIPRLPKSIMGCGESKRLLSP